MRDDFEVELYAFLDIANPMVAWEVAIGRISSGVNGARGGFDVSLWMYSQLRRYEKEGVDQRVVNEFKLERVRQRHSPASVSRLDGLYFFRTEDDAREAMDRWGWSSRDKTLSRVLFSPSQLTVLDSEWITHDLLSNDDRWMRRYWAGEKRGQRRLTETLARGVGLIDNADLRRQAYERIVAEHPLSSKILSFAASAFWCGINTAAQVRPGVMPTEDGVGVDYYIYMRDFETGSGLDMKAVLDQCAADGAVFPYDPRCDRSDTLRVPDFKMASFVIQDRQLGQLAQGIHDETK